jgi:ribosome maturation factor RimP
MAGANPERVRAVVSPVVASVGLDLEDLTLTTAGRRRVLRLAVDRDGGVSLDDVAEVSRLVSQALDDSDVMGAQAYVLEIGSPGVDRPLTQPRHWRRATGRLVLVTLTGGESVTGRILAVEDDGAVLDVPGGDRRIDYPSVVAAKVQVEFNRGGAEAASERDDSEDEGA